MSGGHRGWISKTRKSLCEIGRLGTGSYHTDIFLSLIPIPNERRRGQTTIEFRNCQDDEPSHIRLPPRRAPSKILQRNRRQISTDQLPHPPFATLLLFPRVC